MYKQEIKNKEAYVAYDLEKEVNRYLYELGMIFYVEEKEGIFKNNSMVL